MVDLNSKRDLMINLHKYLSRSAIRMNASLLMQKIHKLKSIKVLPMESGRVKLNPEFHARELSKRRQTPGYRITL